MSILLKRRNFVSSVLQLASKRSRATTKSLTFFTQKLPQPIILPPCKPYLEFQRSKSKGSKKKEEEAASDEDESGDEKIEDFDSLVVDRNTKIVITKVSSLRADVVLKAGLAISRNKVEESFYESKIRRNGKKIFKKSDPVQEGDELDIIKGVSINNPNFLTVARVEILNVTPKKDAYSVRLRRCKSLTVDNYEEAWTGETNQ